MYIKHLKFLLPALFLLNACKSDTTKNSKSSEWVSPMAGETVALGEGVNLQVNPVADVDSVVFYADAERIGSAEGKGKVSFSTGNYLLGIKSINARLYKGGEIIEEIGTNIVVVSSLVPEKLNYSVLRVLPHDTTSYTQGLEFSEGVLYESDGEYFKSSMRKVDHRTGKVLQQTDFTAGDVFLEGITIINDKVLTLTYQENKLFEFDKSSLKLIREFPAQYIREGWGLCNDGEKIYNTDGSNRIYILNKDTYQQETFLEVYDNAGPVDSLNELEFIDGMIYANIYLQSRVVVIDPKTGQVTAEIDFSTLYPNAERTMKDESTYVLNGLAWHEATRQLYVTGKTWDKMFVVQL